MMEEIVRMLEKMQIHKISLIMGIIVATLVLPTIHVSASQEEPEQTQTRIEEERESGFYREDGFPKATEDRPAINPDFAPDESCDLKWELKCIPGSEQSCFEELEGYNNSELNVCTPIGCPEGYHDIFDDEDNICHSNEIDCPNDMILVEDEYGMTCTPLYRICDDEEHRNEDVCIEYCKENPDRLACKPDAVS